jgi:hypothetical protein
MGLAEQLDAQPPCRLARVVHAVQRAQEHHLQQLPVRRRPGLGRQIGTAQETQLAD